VRRSGRELADHADRRQRRDLTGAVDRTLSVQPGPGVSVQVTVASAMLASMDRSVEAGKPESAGGGMLKVVRTLALSFLPYPDPPRRVRVRRAAAALVTCKKWPGDDATGAETAQLALYRILWLQRRTRRAVRGHRTDEAALLARLSLETCIVGLYCLYSGEAVARLSAANYRAFRKVVAYIADMGLMSEEAIDSAAAALGDCGPDLNIKDLASALANQHDVLVAKRLYAAYYVPLSHFFVHANAFTLMRHVDPDGALHRDPVFPWARRAAARLSDACTGLLAGHIARQDGRAADAFLAYADAHLDRLITLAAATFLKTARRSIPWRQIPGLFRQVKALRAYTHGGGYADDPAQQEARIRADFSKLLGTISPDTPESMFAQATEELIVKILDDMKQAAARQGGGASVSP
jgi:hypothetical protein